MTFVTSGQTTSNKQNWQTPLDLYMKLDKEFNFDYDPCPLNPKVDGLITEWGKMNFVNPPYNEVKLWVEKAIIEKRKGKTSVFLIFARTDTKFFHKYIYNKHEIRFLKGRLKFGNNGVFKYPAPAPSMIVIIRGDQIEDKKPTV